MEIQQQNSNDVKYSDEELSSIAFNQDQEKYLLIFFEKQENVSMRINYDILCLKISPNQGINVEQLRMLMKDSVYDLNQVIRIKLCFVEENGSKNLSNCCSQNYRIILVKGSS